MPHHTAEAQPAWLGQHKTHLMIGVALVAMAGGALILARLRPRISRFLAETMAEVAGQMSVEFAPTGAIPVIVSSNGVKPGANNRQNRLSRRRVGDLCQVPDAPLRNQQKWRHGAYGNCILYAMWGDDRLCRRVPHATLDGLAG